MTNEVIEAIHRAREILETEGWTQGVADDLTTGAHCVMGAINIATDYYWQSALDGESLRDRVCYRVGRYIDSISIASWNDEPGRTIEDVLLLLQRAAIDE